MIVSLSKVIESIDITKIENGISPNLYKVDEEIISDFRKLFRQQGWMIGFDWSSWDEGRSILRNKEFDYSTIDLETKRKLLTAIFRNDRFSTGAIESSLNSGVILNILKSI
ncbi:DUF6508 domain-containing protein [Polaribacter sp. L3A8]|uniref:DUF6508 domain-containing protein n=1 Tax=Polaribacter sp. L3A8 TaxID=2686361 RepID=UPI00131D237A|nr:DUF6508 domain-containing protein [Polaribacter sp. L3A8]